MWRLLYVKKKLNKQARNELEKRLGDFDFSCGSSTSDLDLPEELSDVHFRSLRCEDPVERLHYSMGYEPICIQCSSEDDLKLSDNEYPICESCALSKQPVPK